PDVPVRILEVARVSAPERLVGRLEDQRPRGFCLLHHAVDFIGGRDVVTQRQLGRARVGDGKPRIVCDTGPGPERDLQPVLEVEEHDGTMLVLRSDDALGLPAQAVAVEGEGALEVAHPESDYGESRSHRFPLRRSCWNGGPTECDGRHGCSRRPEAVWNADLVTTTHVSMIVRCGPRQGAV